MNPLRVAMAFAEPAYNAEPPFHPGERFPELPFEETSGAPNPPYALLRTVLRDLGLDAGRFGTPAWNPLGGVRIDLGARSALAGLAHARFYGADYDRRETMARHHDDVHVYEVSKTILFDSRMIRAQRWMFDRFLARQSRLGDWAYRCALACYRTFVKPFRHVADATTTQDGGNWHGNDSAWRMAVDLAAIFCFADAEGRLRDRPARRMLCIVDGIVAGEAVSAGIFFSAAWPCPIPPFIPHSG